MGNFSKIDGESHSLTNQYAPHNIETAQTRVNTITGHAIAMLGHIQEQNQIQGKSQQVNQIYNTALHKINNIRERLINSLNPSNDATTKEGLTGKQIKNLAKEIKKAEKEFVKIMKESQIDVLKEISERSDLSKKLEVLAKGGTKAQVLKLLAWTNKSSKEALKVFNETKAKMNISEEVVKVFDNELENSRIHEARDSRELVLKRRAGVIFNQFALTFSPKMLHKQLKSYIAQQLSEKERTSIIRDIPINDKVTLKSELIPLNTHFDESLSQRSDTQTTARVFGAIFGNKGISSANRQEAHLVNAWESNLVNGENQVIYQALRHGITSDKFEKNTTIRNQNSLSAAKELVIAALMQEIAQKKMSLDDAAKSMDKIALNLNSVSLVTPDDLRALINNETSEKTMLEDQVKALHSLEKLESIEIDGKEIPIALKINTFNFGVNAGAVDVKLGVYNQYKYNQRAFKGLSEEVKIFLEQESSHILPDEMMQLLDLKNDIEILMQDEKAYLKGDNQFEIAAKIINLTNLMNKIKNGGYKCSINCMSGKDRTGVLDAIAKAYASMADLNGQYPTHSELMNDATIRKQFQELAVKFLKEAGGLEITDINTGVKGYKVSKHALVGGITEDHFLELVGLSKTTSS